MFAHRGLQAGALTAVAVGVQRGNLALPCPGQTLGIAAPVVLGFGFADEGGGLVQRHPVPAALAGVSVLLQAVDLGGCRSGNVLAHTF